jgi:formate hydrogenlyase subunit 6/NADH:ubiquinone oxidoreductase subunit I
MFKMTPTILKNFLTEKATRLYPFEIREPYAHVRGELVNNSETCNFCGICAAKCPSPCIKVDKKSATWECEPFECVYCGICVDACPQESLSQKELYRKPSAERQHIIIKGEIRPEKPDAPVA